MALRHWQEQPGLPVREVLVAGGNVVADGKSSARITIDLGLEPVQPGAKLELLLMPPEGCEHPRRTTNELMIPIHPALARAACGESVRIPSGSPAAYAAKAAEDSRHAKSADQRDPFLGCRFGCGRRLCRKLEHYCFLPGRGVS
jgi:hypothetical protein